MFLINDSEGNAIMLVARYEEGDGGIWTWTGLWKGATVTPLTPGVKFTGKFFLLGERTWEVVKVNRVTVKLRDVVDGGTYTARIEQ